MFSEEYRMHFRHMAALARETSRDYTAEDAFRRGGRLILISATADLDWRRSREVVEFSQGGGGYSVRLCDRRERIALLYSVDTLGFAYGIRIGGLFVL